MGVDSGLLINLADPFNVTDITGILAKQKTRMRRLDLAVSLLFFLGLFQSLNLGFGQNAIGLGRPFLQPF